MSTPHQPQSGFARLGLAPALVATLSRRSINTPTPIQEGAIPLALQGKDVIGIAQTGTGKTFAFSLPILEQMLTSDGTAVVLVPTRELALQVEESVRMTVAGLPTRIRTISLIGGVPAYRQIRDLKYHPRFIVATPGRLNDLLEQHALTLDRVRFVVLDEADRMFDMGFAPQVTRILDAVPKDRQTLLFSATMSAEVAQLAVRYQQDPERIEVAPAGTSAERIEQELHYVLPGTKVSTLERLLGEHAGTVLVFSRTKHGASKLRRTIEEMGHAAAEIHANRSLVQRRQALDGFKRGRYRVLVATDIAARGIDVTGISLVVNYDLPDAAEDYVHRIGRTGRAGREGKAVSLATPDQHRDVRAIERLIGRSLPVSEHSNARPNEQSTTRRSFPRQGGRPQYQNSSRREQRREVTAEGATERPSVRPAGFISRRSGSSRSNFRARPRFHTQNS